MVTKIQQKMLTDIKKLGNNIGKSVYVSYVHYGTPQVKEGKLEGIDGLESLLVGGRGIPFVGYGSAIRRITKENEVLYENPLILPFYNVRKNKDIDKMIALSFGSYIANQFKEKRIKAEKDWKAEKRKLDEQARTKTAQFTETGKTLIKKELLDKWIKYVYNNTKGFYSALVVEASLGVMEALSKGKSLAKAKDEMHKAGISFFQAGCVAQAISYFHPRGKEFKQYWNRQFLPKEKAEKTKGVVNPAVLVYK
jgi:hypothetical protein